MLSRTRTAHHARAPRPTARLVPSVVASMVLLSSGSFVIFPLIPALQRTLGVSTAEIGYLAAAGFGAALIAKLLVAPAADRGHARLMAVAGVLLVAASLALSAAAGEGWQLHRRARARRLRLRHLRHRGERPPRAQRPCAQRRAARSPRRGRARGHRGRAARLGRGGRDRLALPHPRRLCGVRGRGPRARPPRVP
ncbi:MAG: hypothetical protein ACJLS2_00775 [Microcella pacifica]